uniref:Integrase core domain containing protein n=1 Tax=Solanum tuberosum TaxID=4113 RepID=M0ZZK1_SOLTU
MTQEQLDKEKERDENIKKMLNKMELLQEYMMENVEKPKGTSGVFRVEEGSSSGYSKLGENQSWNSKRYKEGFHPLYLQRGGNQGWNYHKGEEQRRYYQDWAEQIDYWKRVEDHEEDHSHSSESPKLRGSASSPRVNDLLSRILDKVEGSDDLLKGIKANFSSLNNKVNSHADAIKILEGHLSSLSAQLKPKMIMDDDDREMAVVTRSGKVVIGNVMGNEEAQMHEEDGMEEEEAPIHQSIAKGPQKEMEKHSQSPKIHGLRNKSRTEMGNRDNTSKKEKGKTSLMIVDVTRRLAKLPPYRLKLQNVEAKLGVTSASRNSTWCVADRFGDE